MPRGRPKVERVTLQCAACGEDVERRKSEVPKSGRAFCDAECMARGGAKPRRRTLRQCEWCHEDFYPYWQPKARFCSKEHYDSWQRRNRVLRVCEVCDKEFELKPSQAVHLTGRFCTRVCESESRIKHALGRMHNGRPAIGDSQGYVRVYEPEHPNAYKSGWMLEHRLVAEGVLGRVLTSDEHVHHVNGDRADNRPDNLLVMSHGEHSTVTGLANGDRIREWEEYRRRYGPLDS